MRPVPRPKNHLDSFRYAVEGVAHTFRTQRHMRFHFIIVVLIMLLGVLCRFSALELAVLAVASTSVIVAEMLNTAVETVVDMITQSYHPLAKLAKDIAAGAVLIMAINAAVVGTILFLSKFITESRTRYVPTGQYYPALPEALVVVSVIVIVITMITKILHGKGSLLQGGVISGHAAVAFVVAISIVERAGRDVVTVFLAVMLALLVAQSRVEGKIHSLQEVIVGGLLGICITAGVYYFRIGIH